jgi:hypothetical protein
MTPKLRPYAAALRAKVGLILMTVRAHRFWFELGGVTLLVLITAAAVGRTALGRAAALREEAARLEQTLASVDVWLREFQPATPPESRVWRESEQALQLLGTELADPLSVAHLVARRAQELGLDDIRIRLEGTDTVPLPPPRVVGPWSVEASGSAIALEFEGDQSTILSLVGMLPPRVEVGELQISRSGGDFHARLFLFIRQVVQQS